MRPLINYLPSYLRDYKELKEIFNTEQPEINSLWNLCSDAMDNQFINSSKEYGISRWEKMLGIIPKPSETLEERKFRILIYLNEQIPFTISSLNQQLTRLCGVDGYTLELFNDEYRLKVRINLNNKNNYNAALELLERVIPANLLLDIDLLYNQYEKLKKYTHGQLRPYTHDQLRNEVLTSGN